MGPLGAWLSLTPVCGARGTTRSPPGVLETRIGSSSPGLTDMSSNLGSDLGASRQEKIAQPRRQDSYTSSPTLAPLFQVSFCISWNLLDVLSMHMSLLYT